MKNWLQQSSAASDDRFEHLLERLREIASFADDAKNGRHYHAGDDSILTTIYTGQIIAVDRRDMSLAPHLILSGKWEMELSRRCESIVQEIKRPVIFDVGANFGWYGLILSRYCPDSQVHFFEANPSIVPLLQKTVLVNGLALRSSINNCAVSSGSDESLILSIPRLHKGSSSVSGFSQSLEKYYEGADDVEEVAIQSITLDDFCNRNSIDSIDFLKIDVEGFEGRVLSGSRQVIKSSPRLAIMMEWNKRRYEDDLLTILKEFRRCEGLGAEGSWVDLSPVLSKSDSIESFEEGAGNYLGKAEKNWYDLIFFKN
jgi:FkbM family methyltransferase